MLHAVSITHSTAETKMFSKTCVKNGCSGNSTVDMKHTYRQRGSDAAADHVGTPGMISGSPGASDDHKSAHECHLPNQYSPITATTTATATNIYSLIKFYHKQVGNFMHNVTILAHSQLLFDCLLNLKTKC